MTKPPIETMIDSFVYHEYLSDDGDWGKPEYAEPVEITKCRIDRGSNYSSSASGKQLIYNGLLFCYPGMTTPCPEFKEQSKLVYDGKEHIITKLVTVMEPYENKVYCYELEVV